MRRRFGGKVARGLSGEGVGVCVLVEGESDGGGANDRSEAGRVDMIRRGGRRCEGQHN